MSKFKNFVKKNAKKILLSASCMTILSSSTAFAGEAGGTIDESVFTTITNAVESILGLFSKFPINVFLAVSLVGVAIGVIRRLKNS